MKYLFVIVLCTVFFSSCRHNDELTPYDDAKRNNAGTGSAIVNGKPFIGSIVKALYEDSSNSRVSVSIELYNNGYLAQSIGFMKINPVKKKQNIYSAERFVSGKYISINNNDSCMLYYTLLDADVIENTYNVFDSATDNLLTIDAYAGEHLTGNFSITLFRKDIDTKPQTQGMPDTLRITDGKFDVTIK